MHSDDLVPKTTARPETPKRAKRCACPHWLPEGRNCGLITEGLFLPLEQHITAYCRSCHYPACLHYQLLAGKSSAEPAHETTPLNRRRSIRIPHRHLFRFSEITGSDQNGGFREDDAWTVDLSDHGIRFATRQLLPLGATLRFQVDTGVPGGTRQGIGRVTWSQPLEKSPLFHAGIALVESPAAL